MPMFGQYIKYISVYKQILNQSFMKILQQLNKVSYILVIKQYFRGATKLSGLWLFALKSFEPILMFDLTTDE